MIGALAFLAACGESTPTFERPDAPPPHVLPSAAEIGAELAGLDFDALVERSFLRLLERSPESVYELNLEGEFPQDAVRLDDRSAAFGAETNAVVQTIRDAVEDVDRASLSESQRVTYDVYVWYLDDRLDAFEWRDHDYLATPFVAGEPANTELFFTEIHPLVTEEDARGYVDRLWRVGAKMDQITAVVAERAQRGFSPPAMVVGWLRNRVKANGLSGTDRTPYFAALSQKVSRNTAYDAQTRSSILSSARRAIEAEIEPAYRRLDEALARIERDAREEVGVSAMPDGAAFYAALLAHHTTTASTADAIHDQGLADLERIHAEMRARFEALGYDRDASLPSLYAEVATDGGVVPGREVLDRYTEIIEDAQGRLDEAFDLLPSTDVVVIGAASGGFYIGPSLDGSRPGAFYATVGGGGEAEFAMRTLAYHEAVPGHHLQIGVAQDLDLPFFRRITGHTAYIEGWALYAERLASDLGWYEGDAYGDLGRLQYEAFRAARLVVDTGLHDRGWSFERASDFMVDNVGFSRGAADGQVARYISWPGQATAYATGMRKILELRDRMAARQGASFDLRAFHRRVLESGSVPLSVLEDRIDAAL